MRGTKLSSAGSCVLRSLIGLLLALLLAACASTDKPQDRTALPLVEDRPTFLWFFTDP